MATQKSPHCTFLKVRFCNFYQKGIIIKYEEKIIQKSLCCIPFKEKRHLGLLVLLSARLRIRNKIKYTQLTETHIFIINLVIIYKIDNNG